MNEKQIMTACKLHMTPAKCALDLGDGSERGEYVNQDYILNILDKPHRGINLMYCYYPLDKGWPARASTLVEPGKAGFAWGYAYDDYFPYQGGLGAVGDNTDKEPFASMRDVRRHGQEVILTLTVDCAVSDEHIVQIAKDLIPFGRLMLRINHEATGTWFAFNKRYTYQQVADFYVRFHKIVKQHAPHINTILCIGGAHKTENGKLEYEDEFVKAIAEADIWSSDTYLSLHWGWPFDIAEPGGKSHKRSNNKDILEGLCFDFERFKARAGKPKPFVLSEINADGDVNGPFEQAEQVVDFYRRVPKEAPDVTGITFYQFRDRGRLGLEIEDPNNSSVGIAQPFLEDYKKIMADSYYSPKIEKGKELAFPAILRWGSSEDADGITIPIDFESNPVFCEVMFTDTEDAEKLNAMMEINGKWFYKKPGVKSVDLAPAFFKNRLKGKQRLEFRLFAPPASGMNDPSQGEDWRINYYYTLNTIPEFRIRYEPTIRIDMVNEKI